MDLLNSTVIFLRHQPSLTHGSALRHVGSKHKRPILYICYRWIALATLLLLQAFANWKQRNTEISVQKKPCRVSYTVQPYTRFQFCFHLIIQWCMATNKIIDMTESQYQFGGGTRGRQSDCRGMTLLCHHGRPAPGLITGNFNNWCKDDSHFPSSLLSSLNFMFQIFDVPKFKCHFCYFV